jgi:hypothetical protein
MAQHELQNASRPPRWPQEPPVEGRYPQPQQRRPRPGYLPRGPNGAEVPSGRYPPGPPWPQAPIFDQGTSPTCADIGCDGADCAAYPYHVNDGLVYEAEEPLYLPPPPRPRYPPEVPFEPAQPRPRRPRPEYIQGAPNDGAVYGTEMPRYPDPSRPRYSYPQEPSLAQGQPQLPRRPRPRPAYVDGDPNDVPVYANAVPRYRYPPGPRYPPELPFEEEENPRLLRRPRVEYLTGDPNEGAVYEAEVPVNRNPRASRGPQASSLEANHPQLVARRRPAQLPPPDMTNLRPVPAGSGAVPSRHLPERRCAVRKVQAD